MNKLFKIILIIISMVIGLFVAYKTVDSEIINNYFSDSRVFITGNIHGRLESDRINEFNFPEQRTMREGDNLIVVGDFGLIWNNDIKDEMLLDELDKRKYNILFVDGSRENFDLLNKMEVVDLYGGKAHKIRDNIYHLMRGEVYLIGGKKYLVMGGGESMDKSARVEGDSYWFEEIPSQEEWNNMTKNLEEHNNVVDYVLTYSPPSSDLRILGAEIGRNLGKGNEINKNLQILEDTIKYKKWYYSNYHLDLEISKKNVNIYRNIIELN